MRRVISIIAVSVFFVVQAWSQESTDTKVPMIGDKAPAFTAESTQGTIEFPTDFNRKWKILFCHPADFTPVCSSELLELGSMQSDFEKLGVQLVVLSTDRLDTHEQWVKSLETIKYHGNDPVNINFPLVEDRTHAIARQYGMIQPNNNSSKDVRGLYFIGPDNTIRAMLFYPMQIGRNMDEIKRMLIAMQTADSHQVLTPADWQPGGDVLVPFSENTSATSSDPALKNDPDVYQLTWYMTFRKMEK
jgi:peroxiredoxin 2/4